MSDLKGKKILVVGLGKSGMAAAMWLARQGSRVTVSDQRNGSDLDKSILGDLLKKGVILELGRHNEKTFLQTDLIVVSPGVPLDISPLVLAGKNGIPVIGETELAVRYLKTPFIAVTGTNGKSTVVNLIGEMLKKEGKSVFVCGNIGCPLTSYIDGDQKADYVVLEVSSFQLDTIETFCPLISLILNISPDHLDRYDDYNSYRRSKESIFSNQGKGHILILNDDDPWLRKLKPGNEITVYRYGIKSGPERNAFLRNEKITAAIDEGETVAINLNRFSLPGNHNKANVMAAVLTSLALKISQSAMQEGVDHFKGLSHRLELAGSIKGVDFYDDSKATNIDAAIQSIKSFGRPLVLIAGGRHKGSDYAPLIEAASDSVREAVFLGESSPLLADAAGEKLSWSKAGNMDDAVSLAFGIAREGDAVLLAPACSSFDMFKDYVHRGMVFRKAVKGLSNGAEKEI